MCPLIIRGYKFEGRRGGFGPAASGVYVSSMSLRLQWRVEGALRNANMFFELPEIRVRDVGCLIAGSRDD